jgi:hypothetical protein
LNEFRNSSGFFVCFVIKWYISEAMLATLSYLQFMSCGLLSSRKLKRQDRMRRGVRVSLPASNTRYQITSRLVA